MTTSPAASSAALPRSYDTRQVESRWRAHWAAAGLARWDPDRPRGETFVVDTPPPTASGYLHIGHVFSYTHQDIVVRYRRMRGWNIFYPMGWDDNGLPTERRVQDYFNITCDPRAPYDPELVLTPAGDQAGRQPPRPVSRRNFIEACHQVTREDERAFKELFQRIALSVDWSQEYATIDDRSRAVAQLSFLDLHAGGHVYQSEAPTMWDPEFQTAVAQAEVEDREQEGAFHDVEFAVEGSDETFTISTTRPELLAACVAVAAHPDDARYRHLIGRRAITPLYRVPVPIFASPLVDREVGTGILMVCTFGDQTDVVWWRSEHLPLRQVLGRDGRLEPRRFGEPGWESLAPELANASYAALVGHTIAQARRTVVDQLRDPALSATGTRPALRGEPRPIRRPVRFYERSRQPLEYVTSRQWYVRLTDRKQELIERGRQIAWRPDYMRKRFENWTEGLQWDWLISRQRFFGIPIPAWYRLDAEGRADYSAPILPDRPSLPVDPMSDVPPGFREEQRGQPGGFIGEPDVFDTWFTSSLTPQIAARWGLPGDAMDRLFPMDVRPQSHEIIRTWAFYTIAKAMLHHDRVPWHNVVISGWVLDPDRKKMSKSKGNVVTPIGILDQYGADAVRYWAGSARLGVDTAFDEQELRVGNRLVTKLFNAARFVLSMEGSAGPVVNALDRSFLDALRQVVARATAAFEEYEYAVALQTTESFFWSAFTDNYIELVKARARDDRDPGGQGSALATLRLALNVLLRLFAPVLPHVTDELWSWAFARETNTASIHAARWPSEDEFADVAGPDAHGVFQAACEAIAAVRKQKTRAGIGLGYPLTSVTVSAPDELLERLRPAEADLRSTARSAALTLAPSEDGAIEAAIAWDPPIAPG